jgi:hypothetical protein
VSPKPWREFPVRVKAAPIAGFTGPPKVGRKPDAVSKSQFFPAELETQKHAYVKSVAEKN